MRGIKLLNSDQLFKAKIVYLILSKKPEDALKALSQYYNVLLPELRVGMPKGHRRNVGCYIAKKRTIYVSNLNGLHNPCVILHEFYHHLRISNMKHKGTEKHAERFVRDYIEAYKAAFAQE